MKADINDASEARKAMSYIQHLSQYHPKPYPILPGDFHVSPRGSDDADGSAAHPFATIQRAIQAVRAVKAQKRGVTVCVHAGEYPTPGLCLTQEDSGSTDCPITYRAYGDGEVVLDGGVTLSPGDFRPVSGEAKERLHGEARERVVEIDLKRLGLTEADKPRILMIGNNLAKDIVGANAFGIRSAFLRLSPRYRHEWQSDAETPDYVLDRPEELPALLRQIERELEA